MQPNILKVPTNHVLADLNGYQTHAPVLERILEIFKPKDILEFGPGKYSTKLFLDSIPASGSLTCIEMQSQEWADIVTGLFSSDARFQLHCLLGANAWYEEDHLLEGRPDLAFVDGHGESRPEVINYLLDWKVPVIMTHDTECPNYGWDRIKGNSDYTHWSYRDVVPWTDVFIHNNALSNMLKKG